MSVRKRFIVIGPRVKGRGVLNRRAESLNEILIEHPHDDADIGIDLPNEECRGDIHEVVARDDDAAPQAIKHITL